MENTSIKICRENQYTELCTTIQIPFCNNEGKEATLDDFKESCKRRDAYVFDLIGSFAPRIIASLERRMKACQENLVRHLDDIEYSDECGHIVYHRKDGSKGNFNTNSFNAMQESVAILKQSRWREFVVNFCYIDQTIKALMNDPEQDHSDVGKLKYSDLVSFLCENHSMSNHQ